MTEHLINLPSRLTSCPQCGHPIFAATSGGRDIRADVTPLSLNEEIAALLAGKPTYDILIYGLPRRMFLEPRDIIRIRAGRKHAVVAAHTCPALFNPTPVPDTELVFPYSVPLPDDPPF